MFSEFRAHETTAQPPPRKKNKKTLTKETQYGTLFSTRTVSVTMGLTVLSNVSLSKYHLCFFDML